MKKVYHFLSTTSYRFLMGFAVVVIDFFITASVSSCSESMLKDSVTKRGMVSFSQNREEDHPWTCRK